MLVEVCYILFEKFFVLLDYVVVFDFYDFNGFVMEVLNKFGKLFELYVLIEVGFEVDLYFLEYIIVCVWKMLGGCLVFNMWLEDVFVMSMVGICNIGGGVVVVELILVDVVKDGFFLEIVVVLLYFIVFSLVV